MSNKAHITYLFDPLCGWCYGASPLLAQLAALPNLIVALAPTGLFSGTGARVVDEHFANFAWSNDVRIASLTGQQFSEDYRVKVLGSGGLLNSGPATLAVTAVSLTDPSREIDALRLIQEARYSLVATLPTCRNCALSWRGRPQCRRRLPCGTGCGAAGGKPQARRAVPVADAGVRSRWRASVDCR